MFIFCYILSGRSNGVTNMKAVEGYADDLFSLLHFVEDTNRFMKKGVAASSMFAVVYFIVS